MWRVSWQDYRDWRTSDFNEPHPKLQHRDYKTKEDADLDAKFLKGGGLTVCVSPTPGPRRLGKKRQTKINGEGPRFNETWRLTE